MNERTIGSRIKHPKPTLASLIASKNYCCVAAFFAANRSVRTSLIAAWLGVEDRTVRLWRARWRRGEVHCNYSGKCLIKTAPIKLQKRLTRRINFT